ncbi:iron-containing alcohol dehydrogenase [Arthrobacter sp. KNU40]|uniref:iron-containing alcohol dehydrogenase n=1 Tax=Arthrobacter sp. KNU40 TaxID=3447965 RepID=UPI003F648DFC
MYGKFEYVNPLTIYFGSGSAWRLDDVLETATIADVHLITTQSVAAGNVYRRLVEDSDRLGRSGVSIVSSHVPIAKVLAAARDIRRSGAEAVVSIGGGSAVDAAKLSAYGARFEAIEDEISPAEFAALLRTPSEREALPLYAIPTTLSAAELYGGAGYTDSETGRKTGIHNSTMTARAVFYDPQIAEETPTQLWISTGIRAIDHAIEAILSDETNPLSRTLAVSAVNDLFTFLPRAAEGTDGHEERLACFVGAWKSFTSPLVAAGGISHALSRMIGAQNGIPHGVASCVILPKVIRYFHSSDDLARSRLDELAKTTNFAASGSDLADAIEGLILRAELPLHFSRQDVSVEAEAEAALRAAQATGVETEIASAILAQCIK